MRYGYDQHGRRFVDQGLGQRYSLFFPTFAQLFPTVFQPRPKIGVGPVTSFSVTPTCEYAQDTAERGSRGGWQCCHYEYNGGTQTYDKKCAACTVSKDGICQQDVFASNTPAASMTAIAGLRGRCR